MISCTFYSRYELYKVYKCVTLDKRLIIQTNKYCGTYNITSQTYYLTRFFFRRKVEISVSA